MSSFEKITTDRYELKLKNDHVSFDAIRLITVSDVNDTLTEKCTRISYRGRRGLLLPQVPGELGWDVMEYLEGLCMKAGLPRGTWKDTEAEISSFGGKVFHEAEPYGDIREG
jgi:AMMECR1 domain-containing protein